MVTSCSVPAMGMKNGSAHLHRSQVSASRQLGEPENLYALLCMSTLMAAAREEWQPQGHER